MKTAQFKEVHIDIGTGDGNYVYKQALEHPLNLYIGIDPTEKQFTKFAKKANKKRLDNAIFMRGSIEQLPDGLAGFADKITIFYPWGSLLEKVAKADLGMLKKIAKEECELEIVFGYNDKLEPSQTTKLNLENLDAQTIQKNYESKGYTIKEIAVTKESHTSWAKRLRLSSQRQFFRLVVLPNW